MAVPTLTSAEILATGNGRTLRTVWSENVTYLTGQVTAKATALFGQTAKRSISSTGTPTVNNDTVDFTLQVGKPVNQGESGVTVSIPAGTVQSVSTSDPNGIVTDAAMTNNSAQASLPTCRIIGIKNGDGIFYAGPNRDLSGSSIVVEAQAFSPFGISSVDFQVDDGVTTLGPFTVTGRVASDYTNKINARRHRVYLRGFDLSLLNDGPITIQATARTNGGMGTRTHSFTAFNNHLGTLARATYYANIATGNDSTGMGTSGEPYRTIGRSLVAARTAGDAAVTIIMQAAGNYDLDEGFTGGTYTPTRTIRIQGDSPLSENAAVVYDNGVDEPAKLHAAGVNNAAVLEFDRCKINLSSGLNPEHCAELDHNASFGPQVLLEHRLAPNVGVLTGYFNGINNDFWFFGSTIAKVHQATAGADLMRDVAVSDVQADVFQSPQGAIIDVLVSRRQVGRKGLTVQYNAAGPATIRKTATQSGGTLVCNDPVNGDTVFNLTDPANDTLGELATQISAIAGGNWSASVHPDSNSSFASNFAASPATNATVPVTVYWTSDAQHSDMIQWSTSVFTNVLIDGVFETHFDEDLFFGLNTDLQVFLFDFPPVELRSFAIVNVASATFNEGINRSYLQATLTDGFMAFISTPHTRLNLNGNNVGVGYAPTNVFIGYSVVQKMVEEYRDSAQQAANDWSDATYIAEMHFKEVDADIALQERVKAADVIGVLTTGNPVNEFASLFKPTLDLHPATAGQLRNRVAGWPGAIGDLESVERKPSGGAIGALEERALSVQQVITVSRKEIRYF